MFCCRKIMKRNITRRTWKVQEGRMTIMVIVTRPGNRASVINRVKPSRQIPGPIQPLIQLVSWALSPGLKGTGRETDHSPPSSAEVKNSWNYTSTPPYVFIVWCLIKHWRSVPYKLKTFISNIFHWSQCLKKYSRPYHHWQHSPAGATAFLRRFRHICLELDHPVFTSLDFTTIIF
jgi:hypothetical protein